MIEDSHFVWILIYISVKFRAIAEILYLLDIVLHRFRCVRNWPRCTDWWTTFACVLCCIGYVRIPIPVMALEIYKQPSIVSLIWISTFLYIIILFIGHEIHFSFPFIKLQRLIRGLTFYSFSNINPITQSLKCTLCEWTRLAEGSIGRRVRSEGSTFNTTNYMNVPSWIQNSCTKWYFPF